MDARKAAIILFGVLFLTLTALSAKSMAELNINIGIAAPAPPPPAYVVPPPPAYVVPPPPAYVVPAPPPVVVVPGTYVYYVPGIDVDILFYHGHWYRPSGNHWYRARSYNGPWAHIAPGAVPRPLIVLPHDYRRIPPGHGHIPYGQLKKNWARWERDRYWDRGHGGPEGRGHEERGRGHDGDRDWGHGERRGR